MQPKQRSYPSKTTQRKTVYVVDDDEISESSDDNSYETFTISVNNMVSNRTTQPMFKVKLLGTPLTLMADSGARINILDERDFNKLSPQPDLKLTRVNIFAYKTHAPLPILGKFTAPIQSSTKTCRDTFYVVEGTSGSLLSWKTSTNLELLKVVQPIVAQNTPTVDKLTSEYHDLFQGLGKLKNYQVKLHIDETIPPVAQPHRCVPFHVRRQLVEQLRRDE